MQTYDSIFETRYSRAGEEPVREGRILSSGRSDEPSLRRILAGSWEQLRTRLFRHTAGSAGSRAE